MTRRGYGGSKGWTGAHPRLPGAVIHTYSDKQLGAPPMKPTRPPAYINPDLLFYGPRRTICLVPECGRPVSTGDYCAGHYQRVRRTGDPGPAHVRAYRRSQP